MWIDSQTEEEILRGIREAKDLSAYDNLSHAAYLRAKEDYLMGINFSRALTLKIIRVLFFQKTIVLIDFRGLVKPGSLHGFPLQSAFMPRNISLHQNTVKGNLYKLPYLPLSVYHQVIDSVKKQFGIVSGLLNRADVETIYVCTDSGREGEYIYRLVEQQAVFA